VATNQNQIKHVSLKEGVRESSLCKRCLRGFVTSKAYYDAISIAFHFMRPGDLERRQYGKCPFRRPKRT